MKKNELLEKSQTELSSLLMEKRTYLRQLRFKIATSALKNVKELDKIKKEIARILTAMKMKEIKGKLQ